MKDKSILKNVLRKKDLAGQKVGVVVSSDICREPGRIRAGVDQGFSV